MNNRLIIMIRVPLLIAFFILVSPCVLYGHKNYEEFGIASWYGSAHHGKKTASGERFNMNDFTAAHRTLPLGTFVKVTNIKNGLNVIVKINDRGPFIKGRIIDLSKKAAKNIGIYKKGIGKVKIEIVDKNSLSY